jgi:signal transduction histidine kinase
VTVSATDCPPPRGRWQAWRSFAWRGLVTQAFCLAIATLLWWFSVHRTTFYVEWVYSTAIGTSCWLFIDGGRQWATGVMNRRSAARGGTQSAWPGLLWMAAFVVLGSAFGYTVGLSIGNLVTGITAPNLLANRPAVAVSFVAAVVVTYFFYSTERLHHERAAAENARRLAVESQLKLLESQLEPHMLFNTLANLRVLIGLDPPRAQAMLDRLIAYLRATLQASRERTHPLATEYERLADYLQLMAVRLGPRLQFTLDLPDSLRQHPIPPLLLQPLVENAIKHGLEPKVQGGRIGVQASRQGDRLRLDVRDTGAGLHATPAAAPGAHFGTSQVTERLRAVYGPAATFTLAPADDAEGGTLARIELPLAADGTTHAMLNPQAHAPS